MKKLNIMLGFGIMFAFLLVNIVHSVPASPYPFNLTQPDGTIFEAYLRGDEHINWIETSDGYTVIKNKQGWWTYAEEDINEKEGKYFVFDRNIKKYSEIVKQENIAPIEEVS